MTLIPTPFDRNALTSLHHGYRDRGRPDLTLHGTMTDVFIDALITPAEIAAGLLDGKARQSPLSQRRVTLCRKVARRFLEPDLWQRLTPPPGYPRLPYLAIALTDFIQQSILKSTGLLEPTDQFSELAAWMYGTGLAVRVGDPDRADDLTREWRQSRSTRRPPTPTR